MQTTSIRSAKPRLRAQCRLIGGVILAMTAGLGHAAEGAAAKNGTVKAAQALPSGIATRYIEPAVRPQNDFSGYVNGKWLKSVEIPADQPSWGSFVELNETTQAQLRGLIEKAAASNPAAGTDARRIGDYYASFMDEARLEQLGHMVNLRVGCRSTTASARTTRTRPATWPTSSRAASGWPTSTIS